MIRLRFDLLWILLPAAAVFSGGCRLGEEYKQPELDVPEVYRGSVDEGESIANLGWWELFDDEVLHDLIRIALEENKDLKLAAARIRAARGVLRASRAEEMPQIDAVSNFEFEQPSKEVSPGAEVEETYELGLRLSWELDLWGELKSATDAAIAELIAEEEIRRGIIITLVADVAEASVPGRMKPMDSSK